MLDLLSILVGTGCLFSTAQQKDSPPNILWIVCEDTSPHLGCYGDKFATTPNIDKFAQGGVLFEHVFSAPACSPSRSTLITGMCASTLGTENLRSKYPIPDFVKFFPSYLRKAGYYTTNNGKEDYNTFMQHDAWDESSPAATYMNRKAGQPFFAVFNIGITHESKIHRSVKNLKHDPEQVPLPPYHPATPEMKHDWALFYDNIMNMDEQVGKMLDELEVNGLSDNTIVFFFSDNGGVIAGSKRFINESGLHVPLIIRFPEKYKSLALGKPGSRNARIISFEDFAPTLLSLAEVEIPNYMEGKAFLGKQQAAEKEYAFAFRSRIDERIDIIRSIRSQRYRYVRNYMPHKIYGQHTEYMWQAASVGSWEKAFRSGSLKTVQETFWKQKPAEELYDVTVDPFNVKNLAFEKEYSDILNKMRIDNRNTILHSKDAGFIPEAMKVSISDTSTIFEFARSDHYPLSRILETAEMASSRNADFSDKIIERLGDENSIVRYWAALGCCILKPESQEAKSALIKLLKDDETVVRIMASEALYHLGEKTSILPVLTEALESDNMYARLEAVTALEVMGQDAGSALPALSKMISKREDIKMKNEPTWKLEHDIKIAKQLVKKLSN